MEDNFNLSQNIAECIKTQWNIGDNVYYNICSGNLHVVPWGSMDWFSFILMASLIPALIFVIYVIKNS